MALAPLLMALAQALAPRKLLLFGRLSGKPLAGGTLISNQVDSFQLVLD